MPKFYDAIFFAQSMIFPGLQRHKIKTDYTDEEQQQINEAKKCYLCDIERLKKN